MMVGSGKRVGAIILLIGVIVWGSAVSWAQSGYPSPDDLYINDYAGVISSSDSATIRTLLSDLKTEHDIEATVLTIQSIHDYDTGDVTIESFATNLFNTWGIGSIERNDGVLILVAVQDRRVRIEVGSGYGESLDEEMGYVINEFMLSSFRRNEYSQGITNGVRAVIHSLTGIWPDDFSPASSTTTTGYPVSSTTYSDDSSSSSSPDFTLIGGGAGAAGVVGVAIQRYRRYHRRRCPECGTWMTRLDEVSDDVYLDSGQKVEEVLASVNYDIWKCPQCSYHTLYKYNALLSSFRRCSGCGYRTMTVYSQVDVRPTYTSTGSKTITENCRHCNHHRSHNVVLPRLTRSSSGSSSSRSSGGRSSFGGGRSSGGGASGSW